MELRVKRALISAILPFNAKHAKEYAEVAKFLFAALPLPMTRRFSFLKGAKETSLHSVFYSCD
jgi:hypothetical protein